MAEVSSPEESPLAWKSAEVAAAVDCAADVVDVPVVDDDVGVTELVMAWLLCRDIGSDRQSIKVDESDGHRPSRVVPPRAASSPRAYAPGVLHPASHTSQGAAEPRRARPAEAPVAVWRPAFPSPPPPPPPLPSCSAPAASRCV